MAVPEFASDLRAHGTAPALTFAHGTISYRELADRVDRLAARMGAARKLVAIEAALSCDAIAAYLAALKAGHVALLAPAGNPAAWRSLLERFQPELQFRRVDGRWRTDEAEAGDCPALHPELALLLVTSGSSGAGKAVRLAGSALAANASAIAQYLQLGPADRGTLLLPIHYSYGLSVLNSHLTVGASLCVTEGSILDPGFLEALRAQRCTNFAGVPYSYDLLENVGFRQQAFPDLRFMTVAGGRLAEDMVRRYERHLSADGKRFFVMYGQTEATARIAYVPPAIVGERPACIGVAIPGGELGLIDDAGRPIDAPDTEGELVYRGPNVMLGYAERRADLSRGAEVDLLRTGDMAVRDADGLYRVTGRRRRISKIAGVRIGHDAIEATLAHAGITAAVVGDDRRILAACMPPCSPHEARTRLAAAAGLPMNRVQAVEVEALPRLASGKVDYETLRRRLDEGGDKPPSDLLAAFRQVFWPQPVAMHDSFDTLGGDSLRYLELSRLLDRRLGRTPLDWGRMSVAALTALAPHSGRRSSVATDIVIRVTATLMILVHHATGWPLPAGAATMMLLIGYGLGRFQLQTLLARQFGRFFRPLLTVLAPYALILVGYALFWQAIPWASLFLIGNLGFGSPERHTMLPYLYWFVEAYAQTLLIWAGLFLLPPVRRLAARDPFRLGLLLLAAALVARLVGPEVWPFGDRKLFAPWWLLPLVALGWCAATSDTASKRILLVAVATSLMTVLAYAGGNWLGSWIRYGLQVPVVVGLLYLPQLQMPAWPARMIVTLGASAYHIYLFHYFVPRLFAGPLDWLPPALAPLVVILAGVAVGIAAHAAQLALMRQFKREAADVVASQMLVPDDLDRRWAGMDVAPSRPHG